MTKQIKIEELIPFMKKGWVACDEDGTWLWYFEKPKLEIWMGCWNYHGSYYEEISNAFNIIPAKDWTKSLKKAGKEDEI